MDFAVKFAQVLIWSGPNLKLGLCKIWFKFEMFQEQKLYEFYQAVVPPERRERHRWEILEIYIELYIWHPTSDIWHHVAIWQETVKENKPALNLNFVSKYKWVGLDF